ncbi:sterol desaturase family protein [Deinococcus roseus]|uniref:Fatty acid hydroxylase domain-containing protein n=1 Tax=Deinococcus roseus TaxID=392414 RepID=A0ABQ2CYH2_9DEIO|nr:sterol desaturase family protein [Deinococcus roseus]GGJ32911.1 hypothetical protein GCM10008938_18930 [Deinococcus roseus]
MFPVQQITQALYNMPFGMACLWALTWNVLILLGCVAVGELLIRLNRQHRVAEVPPPLTFTEVGLAVSTVVLNTLISVLGMWLWRMGWIHPVPFSLGRMLLDFGVFFLGMDLGMYVLHRVAHHPRIYPWAHLTHHKYENPRPLTLFVLNPLEVLGFGFLWLFAVLVYPATVEGMVLYLTFNVVFGLLGHVGVEPFPLGWIKRPVLKEISTSTFHAEHHQDSHHNYGFYTLIWDRLLGTLSPAYEEDFQRARTQHFDSSD